MTVSKYYFTEDEYEYFLKIFSEANQLPWQYVQDENYFYVEVCFIPPSDNIREFAKKYPICLRKLKAQVRKNPPAALPLPDCEDSRGKYYCAMPSKTRQRPVGLVICSAMVILLGIMLFIYKIIYPGTPRMQDVSQNILLMDQCQKLVHIDCLAECKDKNALECYQEILRLAPDNAEAINGLKNIESHYIFKIRTAIEKKDIVEARRLFGVLIRINPVSPDAADLRKNIEALEKSALPKPTPKPDLEKTKPHPAKKTSSFRRKAKSSKKPPAKSTHTDSLVQESLGAGFNQ